MSVFGICAKSSEKFLFNKCLTYQKIHLILAHRYISLHLITSRQRESFFTQLHTLLPKISKGSVLFFDRPVATANSFDDYFRVGVLPSESAIGAEYSIDFNEIKLITDTDSYENERNKISLNNLYVFYYDGDKLIDNTKLARNLLKQTVPQRFDWQNPENSFIIPAVRSSPLLHPE